MSIVISPETAKLALRALLWMEPSSRSWAALEEEKGSQRVYAALVAARMEIQNALKEQNG